MACILRLWDMIRGAKFSGLSVSPNQGGFEVRAEIFLIPIHGKFYLSHRAIELEDL